MTAYRNGADPEALTGIARSLSAMQAELNRLESSTRSAVGTIRGNWSGDDLLSLVDTFTTTCLPGLRACSGALDAMARRLDDNVAAQRAASGTAHGCSGGADGGGGPTGPGGLNDVTRTQGKKYDANLGGDSHGKVGLIDGALGAVNWTHKDEDVRTDYQKTFYDAAGDVTDEAHADHAAYGGTLGTESRHHAEAGLKDGALYAGAGAGAGAYLLRGGVEGNLGEHGKYEASGFVGAEAKADASVSLGKEGLRAKVGAEAFAGAKGEAGISYDDGPFAGHAAASAMAGAEAKADTSIGIGKDGIKAHAGAEAFAGAKAAAELGGSIAGIGGTVGGEVYAGIGGHAKVDAVFSAERVKANVDVGAAVGVGAGAKFSVDVQPKEFVDDVGHGLGGAGSAIEGGFRQGAESVGRVFGW
ncbi:hypothetical protein [Terrabacter sp. MAHUQ-38]|uniref:hypothetical protein n=1 Tax=unclassified Terrabacter TaxID=2630222 RepID=UPI00165D6817|nr:hypothetical protein [Terrabacter sp. MAHUQ-38]MBC9820320.1 hypothetical protein [Terrabacter sp. MAHUQ-38]